MRSPLRSRPARRAVECLLAADVGLVRLRAAIAATTTTFLTVLTLLMLARAFDARLTLVIPGVLLTAVSTMAPGLDPNRRTRLGTMLLAPLAGAAGVMTATLVTGDLVWTAVAFMALVVVTLLGALIGPRGLILGLTAVICFYGADLVDVQVVDAPQYVVGVVAAGAVAVLVLQVLFRDRPELFLARVLRSLDVLASRLQAAAGAGDVDAASALSARLLTATSAAHLRIQEAPQVWPLEVRRHAGKVLADLAAHLRAAQMTGAGLSALAEATRQARRQLRTWTTSIGTSRSLHADGAPRIVDGGAVDAAGATVSLPATRGGRSQISMAVQLLVATGISLVVSMTINRDKWFWGVLAALAMLFGTSSVAEAIGKGARRALGTAAALPAALVIGYFIDANTLAIVVGMVIAMFFQQYFADVAYGVSVFFLTLFLSFVFAISGGAATDTLELRLIETVAGAVVGALVALLVLPARTGTLLRGRAADLLEAARATIRLLLAGASPASVQAGLREVDQRFEQLRVDADTSRHGWPFSRAHRMTAQLLAAVAVAVGSLQELARRRDEAPLLPAEVCTIRAAETELEAIETLLRGDLLPPRAGEGSPAGMAAPQVGNLAELPADHQAAESLRAALENLRQGLQSS